MIFYRFVLAQSIAVLSVRQSFVLPQA